MGAMESVAQQTIKAEPVPLITRMRLVPYTAGRAANPNCAVHSLCHYYIGHDDVVRTQPVP